MALISLGRVFIPANRSGTRIKSLVSWGICQGCCDVQALTSSETCRSGGASYLHSKERGRMEELNGSDTTVGIPKHILDIWAIVLIILATIIIMMSLVLCPATAVIIYRVRTHPIRNGAV
ncbi:small integral membrane protein 3 [Alligator sinensis]|uniref:Small integral membrane protein 3 n=1 Tax=Alligator sinensis TaxID=38654 RepID=A0A3Q0GF66_ALLSI|nr:small integral membrane protein 3 [Alligator sinensis]